MTEVLLRKGGWTRGAGGTWGAGKDGMLLLLSHPMIMIWITMMMRRRKGC